MTTMPADELSEPRIERRPRFRLWPYLPLIVVVIVLAVVAKVAPPDGAERADAWRFLGRFHPAIVHAPIGMLLLVPVLDLAGTLRARWRPLRETAGFVLWLGALGAVFASVVGYLFAYADGYGGEGVIDHQWAGIATSAAAVVALPLRAMAAAGIARIASAAAYAACLAFMLVCLAFTGHLGGGLTHGNDFLAEFAPPSIARWLRVGEAPASTKAPIIRTGGSTTSEPTSAPASAPSTRLVPGPSMTGSRTVYEALIQPMFTQTCVSCHGPTKVKGGLWLDSYEHAMAGGDSGSTIVPGKPDESELYKLVTLPHDDQDAMPPEGKPRPSAAQIEALRWWIAEGASDTKVVDAGVPAAVAPLLEGQ